MVEVVAEGGRGGAVEVVGVVGYLRRPCLSFCRICREIQSTKNSISSHYIQRCTAMHYHENTPASFPGHPHLFFSSIITIFL